MKPFLKWAGNKFRILDQITKTLPSGNRLMEPFVGSGAVFLNTDYSEYLLSDSNADLINLFIHLKYDGASFINYCRQYFNDSYNTADEYYRLRSEFNTTIDLRYKAALFLYLNRHGFNGLCRYNNDGGFNVPFGKYKKPYFPETEMLFFWNKAKKAEFRVADFQDMMDQACFGDVIYCDPPYVPLSKTANFTSYSSGGFSEEQQIELANLAKMCQRDGISVLISNHALDFTFDLYKGADIYTFDVRLYISCKGDGRNNVSELLALFK